MDRWAVWASLVLSLWLIPARAEAQAATFIRLSPDGTRLIDPNGNPVFMAGDAAWSLIVQGTRADVDLYVSNRAAKGINVLLVNLIDKVFCQNCPRNIYNDPPFTTPGNFTTTAGATAYWAHADYVIGKARDAGITLMLAPMYLGWDCSGSQGWCPEVQASTTAAMRSYGEFLGNRYKDYPNIIWIIGGDTNPFTYNVAAKLEAMVAGIKTYDRADRLFTAHNGQQPAQAVWTSAAWLNLNNTYAYGFTTLMDQVVSEYNRPGGKPLFHLEAAYEHDPTNASAPLDLRQQAYGTALWGAKWGHIFGNCPLWGLGPGTNYPTPWCAQVPDWRNELNSTGSVQFGLYASLIRSRRFWLFVPDHNHTVMTAGYGSGSTLATTSRASDGSSIVSYIPTRRQVTIDMSKITDAGGQAACSWYNPQNGQYTSIGTYATSGSRNFTPPTTSDWVLVLDAAGATALLPPTGLSASGSASPPQSWNACDLSQDTAVNVVDVQLGVNMALAITPCAAAINGIGVCNVVTVQRVINAGLGLGCVLDAMDGPRTATLTWTASPSSGVAGYNVSRASVSGGPYARVNAVPVAGTRFFDVTVQAGQTYYYVAAAVDAAGALSSNSNQAVAVVP